MSYLCGLWRFANAYYEYIWKGALQQVGDIRYTIDMYLTAVFSIINRKISAYYISEMFNVDIEVWKWEDILQNLFPIIKFDQFGYSVVHNDVRIYLASHYKRAKQLIPKISGQIADFLMEKDFDNRTKHELVFKLLEDAERKNEYVDVFTSEYVIEGYYLKRDPKEIRQQMLSTLESLIDIEDKRKIVKFSCAVTTMQQREESFQWLNMQYQYEVDIPFALECERKVVMDIFLTIDDIRSMFISINFLLQHEKQNRVKRILECWMGARTPKTLLVLWKKCELDDVYKVLETWGKYARIF